MAGSKFSCGRTLACLTVMDNGGGTPDDIRAKVFAPDFTAKAQGSGIGLR